MTLESGEDGLAVQPHPNDGDSKRPSSCLATTVDREAAQDPFEVPLKRSLKSRHLQMIAVGGADSQVNYRLYSAYLTLHHQGSSDRDC